MLPWTGLSISSFKSNRDSIFSSSSSESLKPSPSRNLMPLYSAGLCEALMTAPPSKSAGCNGITYSGSRDLTDRVNTPSCRRYFPAQSAYSIMCPEWRGISANSYLRLRIAPFQRKIEYARPSFRRHHPPVCLPDTVCAKHAPPLNFPIKTPLDHCNCEAVI